MKFINLHNQSTLKNIEGIRKQDENSFQKAKRLDQEAKQLIDSTNKQP